MSNPSFYDSNWTVLNKMKFLEKYFKENNFDLTKPITCTYADSVITISGINYLGDTVSFDIDFDTGGFVTEDEIEEIREELQALSETVASQHTVEIQLAGYSGTLSSVDRQTVIDNYKNVRFVNEGELYFFQDFRNGNVIFTHVGEDMSTFHIKCIKVTLSSGVWVLDDKEITDGGGGGGFKLYEHIVETMNANFIYILSWEQQSFYDKYGGSMNDTEIFRNEPSILFAKLNSWQMGWSPVVRDNTDGYCYTMSCSIGGTPIATELGENAPIMYDTVTEIS